MQKNSFVLRNSYADIFSDMTDKQAGVLIKVIFKYIAAKDVTEDLKDVEVKMAWKFIKQDIDYDTQKYEALCIKRAEYGKQGGRPKANGFAEKHKVSEKAKGFSQKHIDSDSVVDSDSDIKQQLLTADIAAGKALSKPKKLNDLQKFSNAVIENFEQNVQTSDQKRIWFRRNCRCLTDILNYCGKNIPLALATIEACAARLQKANLCGGYEAVCRNLPEYMGQAQKEQMEVKYASYAETREKTGNLAK